MTAATLRFSLALLLAAAVAACGGGGGQPAPQQDAGNDAGNDVRDVEEPTSLFHPAVTSVTFEVDYASGAEPWTDTPALGNPWQLLQVNAAAIFGEDGPTVVVPDELESFEDLGDVGGPDFDVAAIMALAAEHRDLVSTSTAPAFYVLFLDGWFEQDGDRLDTVLGLSLRESGIIALFKPVIDGSAAPRMVEQLTLVHEFGHLVGLVSNGLEMVGDHHDAEHGAHCTDDRCAMYWQHEGATAAAHFVQNYLESNDAVIFGPDCMADVEAARAAH